MDKDLNYYKLLARQYYMAMGKNIKNERYLIDNCTFSKDISRFICERQLFGARYTEFLNYLGLDITKRNIAEIGKGMYDTLVSDYETTVITPHTYIKKNGEVLDYRLTPSKSGIYMIKNEKDVNELINSPDFIDTFMTENPYGSPDLFNWDIIHNVFNQNIIVGVYGHIHDNDKLNKLRMLKGLKDKLESDIMLEYETDRDAYYATVFSDRLVKNYEKVKSLGKIK